MPNIPLHPILPGLEDPSPQGLLKWSESLLAAIRRLWTTLTYTVNALSLVDTLANRTSTPGQNHIFFTTSNSKETFVGVAGAWQMVGPRRGSVTMTAATTTATVTLSPATADTSYRVALTPSWNAGGLWVTSKGTSSFIANAATAPGSDGTVDWQLTRD